METTDKIIIFLTIAVIILLSSTHTTNINITQLESNLTSLNNSLNLQLNKNIHLSDYYYNITEQQTQNIEELIEENQLLRHHIYYQEWNITNLSTQLKESEIKTAQYKYLSNKLSKERIIHTPKYEDVIKFARNDNTKYNTYDAPTYDCKSFTEDYIKNSISEGLYACFARIYYTNGDWHAVAQYNTNKGKIYIDPQSGNVIKLTKGMIYGRYTVDYWTDCIGGGI